MSNQNAYVHEQQEDRYYRLKAAIEEAAGVTLSSEAMNRLYFDVLEPPYRAWQTTDRTYREVVEALQFLSGVAQSTGTEES